MRSASVGPSELEDERFHAVRFFETVDARDVRMVQRRQELRFPVEARPALFVFRERVGIYVREPEFNRVWRRHVRTIKSARSI